MRMVAKHRWPLDDLGDEERRRRLLDPPSALVLLHALVAEATRAAHDGQILFDPRWDPCTSRPEFGRRVHAAVPVSQVLFDQLLNRRSGYRAQYCLSITEGRRYNRAIIDALIPALRHTIWVADDEEHFQNAPDALRVPDWTGKGRRVPLPSSPRVDVKGMFIPPGTQKEFTTKSYRDRCLHEEGWPG